MSAACDRLLDHYALAARRGDREEAEFRDNYYATLKRLERARVLAHRRHDLVGKVSRAVMDAGAEDDVRARVAQVLRDETGLSPANEAHAVVIERFHAVTDALVAMLEPESETIGGAAIAEVEAFETWYRERTGQEFFALCDVYVPETPRVDF